MRFLPALLIQVLIAVSALAADRRPLVVISIDGMDHRYLRDRDKLGVKIPNIRRLIAEGKWADGGVVGVMPSETFPAHTTMMTGKLPMQHGILQNDNPKTGERNWFSSQIQVPVLWDAARAAGLKTASIDWPVTVGAQIDFDFPEKFNPKSGSGQMTLADHAPVSTPGLIEKISARYPSFATARVDDGTRTLAALYVLQEGKADLILLHLVDHDSAAHDFTPFARESIAALEFADECLGRIVQALPKTGVIALVSDHGFEKMDRSISLKSFGNDLEVQSKVAITSRADVAERLRASGLTGGEIPQAELQRYAADWAGKYVFEPPEHAVFGDQPLKASRGSHGYWPRRKDYRSAFVLWGNGVKTERLHEIEMTSLAARFAEVLGLRFPGN